jgi:hypothetical protein
VTENFELRESQGLSVGKFYSLSVGQAEVIGFYEENGLQKVQALITPFSPEDGRTPLAMDAMRRSMPIANFLHLMRAFESDQIQRSELQRRRERRQRR